MVGVLNLYKTAKKEDGNCKWNGGTIEYFAVVSWLQNHHRLALSYNNFLLHHDYTKKNNFSFFWKGYFTINFHSNLTQTKVLTLKLNPNLTLTQTLTFTLKKQMKNAQMNIIRFCFTLFRLQFCGEMVTLCFN